MAWVRIAESRWRSYRLCSQKKTTGFRSPAFKESQDPGIRVRETSLYICFPCTSLMWWSPKALLSVKSVVLFDGCNRKCQRRCQEEWWKWIRKTKERTWHGKCGTWMGHAVQRERFRYDGARCMTCLEQSLCMILGRNVHEFLSLAAAMPPMFSAPMAMRYFPHLLKTIKINGYDIWINHGRKDRNGITFLLYKSVTFEK